jgi:hypothetical protein
MLALLDIRLSPAIRLRRCGKYAHGGIFSQQAVFCLVSVFSEESDVFTDHIDK